MNLSRVSARRGRDGKRSRADGRYEVEEVLEGDVGRRVSKVVQYLEDVPSRSVHVVVQVCKRQGISISEYSVYLTFNTLLALRSIELDELFLFQNILTEMGQHLEEVSSGD